MKKLMLVLGCAGGLMVAAPGDSLFCQSVSITSPKCGGTFSCTSIRDNQCFFSVMGTSKGLSSPHYVCVFLKYAGGKQWWQGGNCVRFGSDFDKDWTVSMLSVDPKGISKNFTAKALVTETNYPAGANYLELPKHIIGSNFCQIALK